MENNETTPETAPETAPETTEEPKADPSVIGRLSPEEQAAMMKIRSESQQLLAKVGEHELLKLRIMQRIEELDEQGQGIINSISQRLGLEDGQQWVGLQDGTIRLVNKPDGAQNQGGGAQPS
jgi:hypothetical protein